MSYTEKCQWYVVNDVPRCCVNIKRKNKQQQQISVRKRMSDANSMLGTMRYHKTMPYNYVKHNPCVGMTSLHCWWGVCYLLRKTRIESMNLYAVPDRMLLEQNAQLIRTFIKQARNSLKTQHTDNK